MPPPRITTPMMPPIAPPIPWPRRPWPAPSSRSLGVLPTIAPSDGPDTVGFSVGAPDDSVLATVLPVVVGAATTSLPAVGGPWSAATAATAGAAFGVARRGAFVGDLRDGRAAALGAAVGFSPASIADTKRVGG